MVAADHGDMLWAVSHYLSKDDAARRRLDLPAALGEVVGFALEGQPIDADPAWRSITRHHLFARYTIFACVQDGESRMG